MFLQALANVHQFSVACPHIYFGSLICLVLVVSKGWYTLGRMQVAAIGLLLPRQHWLVAGSCSTHAITRSWC